MRFKIILLITVISTLILSACGSAEKEENNNGNTSKMLTPIDVQLNGPENIAVNEEVKFTAIVTQDGKKVSDAEEVEFEVGMVGQDNHEKIKAINEGNGVYSLIKSFDQAGEYTIISHVTARDMHAMPQKEFKVEGEEAVTQDGGQTHNNSEGTDHHANSLSIHFMKSDQITLNQETSLIAHIIHGHEGLEGADVQFEIWRENTAEDEKEYLRAKENGNGHYEAITSFKQKGKYLITIHVVKDELHDHIEEVITVQ